jgi:hypothetical protein
LASPVTSLHLLLCLLLTWGSMFEKAESAIQMDDYS